MSTWAQFESAQPEHAAALKARFDAHLHKLLATIRKDGSPRISGIEATFRFGELWLAGMPASRKFDDLRRDPRLALHSSSEDSDPSNPGAWPGDAKLSGVAHQVTDPETRRRWADAGAEPLPGDGFELFRVDIVETVHVHVGEPADHLVIDHWTPQRGLTRTTRT